MSYEEPRIQTVGIPNKLYRDLKPTLRVALKILEYNDVHGKSVHFSQLVQDLESVVSRASINEALSLLIDEGSLHSEWQKDNKTGHWIRVYRVAGEDTRDQLRILYKASHSF